MPSTGCAPAGVGGVNFDLIYGLPHQTVATLTRTIELCAEMSPDRVALFGYAHVPWKSTRQRMIPAEALPGAAERIDQAEAAARQLVDLGYQAIGLDHFALPDDPLAVAARNGTLRRNFQGYTTDQANTLIGLGATSIGRTPSGHVQNIAETGAWSRSVADGRLPVAKGYAFAGEDVLRGDVIEAIMCRGEVDLDALGQRHGAPSRWYEDRLGDLAALEADGLIRSDGAKLRVTGAGRPYVRAVAAIFDSFLARGGARHSVAV